MKIFHKLTLTLLGSVLAALALNAHSAVRTEIVRFEKEIGEHQAVIGTALRPAVLDVWRSDGPERALQIVDQADKNMRHVLIRWVWLGPTDPKTRPAIAADRFGEIVGSTGLTWIDTSVGPHGRLYTYVPVKLSDGRDGAIEVSQPLDRESQVREAAMHRALLTAMLVAAVSALVTTALGNWLIGRPMRRLVEQARRTGSGDLSYRIHVKARDEMGELAAEMNRMCESLAAAQASVERESEARLQATDALRHADRVATVGRLAAGMAHELGTPLNVVAARAKQIAAGSTTPEATRENARIIADQVERMSRIMRQLLDFARKRELQSVSTDLRSILKRAAAFLSPLARKRGLDLRVVNPPEPIVARIDVAQMDQVVTNLVMNAIHASPEGKRVSVELSQAVGQYPAAEAKTSVPCVRIDVTDEGSGIEQENLRQIFDPFFTTKPIGEGTGLGLSVAYGIVKDHGGWIDVDSEPGRGSRFTVWLPTEVS